MKEFTYTVTDALGIHARPAGQLAKTAAQFKSSVTMEVRGQMADVKRVIGVMRLCAKQNDALLFRIEGEDEELAAAELETFCKATL